MQVRATKTLQYGIVRKAGAVFTLASEKHFDARVMERVEAGPAPVKAPVKAPAPGKAPTAKEPAAGEVVIEEPETTTETSTSAAPAASGGSSASAPRRRSTAAQRGNA